MSLPSVRQALSCGLSDTALGGRCCCDSCFRDENTEAWQVYQLSQCEAAGRQWDWNWKPG
jgi:hypothetical protein